MQRTHRIARRRVEFIIAVGVQTRHATRQGNELATRHWRHIMWWATNAKNLLTDFTRTDSGFFGVCYYFYCQKR